MKLTGITLALLVVAGLSIAGVKVVDSPGHWTFNGTDEYNTKEQCVAEAKLATIDDEVRVCHKLDRVILTGDCSDVPRPAFTPELLEPELCPDGVNYRISETQQVAAPFAACWAVVAVVKTECPK